MNLTKIPGGFTEIHFHGACGHKTTELDRGVYETFSRFLEKHGTTSFLASFSAAPPELMKKYLKFCRKIMEEGLPGARLAGIHLEGPCLRNAGGMTESLLIPPDLPFFRKLFREAPGVVKMMTLAPELPGTCDLIELLCDHGITAAAGHTSCSAEELRNAVAHGVSHITHLGNNFEGDIRCNQGRYEHDGPLLECLVNDALTCEVICDGVHVCPELVKIFYRSKGLGRFAAVTDCCAAAGLPGRSFEFPDPAGTSQRFEVKRKALYIAGTDRLTGSLLSMNTAYVNLRKFAGISGEEAAAACSMIPRRIAGIRERAEEFAFVDSNGTVRKIQIQR